MTSDATSYFEQHHDAITSWRQHLHAHPGLLYDVQDTADFVADKLRGFGVDEVVTGLGQTGVVGLIRGRGPATNAAIGLRADMDALPITEATGVPYASTRPGLMHACGHDGHIAMLLGAAQYLAATRDFDGTIAVIFQPAEEGGNGAKAMIDDGMIERFGLKEVYGLHNRPGLAKGQFASRPAELMASADVFGITITGKGGHAARPHLCVDPMLVASQINLALQAIVAQCRSVEVSRGFRHADQWRRSGQRNRADSYFARDGADTGRRPTDLCGTADRRDCAGHCDGAPRKGETDL